MSQLTSSAIEPRIYSPQKKSKDSLFSPGFIRILVIQLAFGVSFSAFLLLPKYLRLSLHASAAEIGTMAGIALLVAAVCSPFVGHAAKRFDRRKLLALALLLEGGAALGFVYVSEIGPYAYALRVSQGIAFVLIFNCTTTIAADMLPPQHLARGVGYLGVSMLLTNALAPLVNEPLAEKFGWHFIFGLAGVIALSSLALISGIAPVAPPIAREKAQSRSKFLILTIHYGSFLMGAGLGAMFTFVQPFALEQGAQTVGQFFLGYVAAAVVARVGLGGLSDSLGPSKVAVGGICLYALVVFATASLTPEGLVVAGAGLGAAHGFLYPALSASGLQLTPPHRRSIFMGWFAGAFNSGFALSVLILGRAADKYGYSPIFLALGALITTGIFPLIHTHLQMRRGLPAGKHRSMQ